MPERRHHREEQHRRVAGRQLRTFGHRTQLVIGTARVGMMIRVPLEVEQPPVGHAIVCIPGVPRLHPFIPAIGQLLALEPIVLDVVDDLEQNDGQRALRSDAQEPPPAVEPRRAGRLAKQDGGTARLLLGQLTD